MHRTSPTLVVLKGEQVLSTVCYTLSDLCGVVLRVHCAFHLDM